MTHSIWTTRNIYFSTHWNSLRECKYISQNPGFVHNLFVWFQYISFHDIMEEETHDIVLRPLVVSGNCYLLPSSIELLTLDTCDLVLVWEVGLFASDLQLVCHLSAHFYLLTSSNNFSFDRFRPNVEKVELLHRKSAGSFSIGERA